MGSNRKFDRPIWKLEAEWERWISTTYSENYVERATAVVFKFVDAFPDKRKPDDWQITDVQDWITLRSRQIAPSTLRTETEFIHCFFEWLYKKGVLRLNPVRVTKSVQTRSATPRISLAQLRGLMSVAIRPEDTQLLQAVLSCESRRLVADRLHLSPSTVGVRFRHLRVLANLPPEITIRTLRKAYLALALRLGERAVLALLLEGGTHAPLPADGVPAIRPVELPRMAALADPALPC